MEFQQRVGIGKGGPIQGYNEGQGQSLVLGTWMGLTHIHWAMKAKAWISPVHTTLYFTVVLGLL